MQFICFYCDYKRFSCTQRHLWFRFCTRFCPLPLSSSSPGWWQRRRRRILEVQVSSQCMILRFRSSWGNSLQSQCNVTQTQPLSYLITWFVTTFVFFCQHSIAYIARLWIDRDTRLASNWTSPKFDYTSFCNGYFKNSGTDHPALDGKLLDGWRI